MNDSSSLLGLVDGNLRELISLSLLKCVVYCSKGMKYTKLSKMKR